VFELTPRQKEILEFVRHHHASEGFWPSIRDVQRHFQFKSTNAVIGHLRALERKGAIERAPGQARAFRTAGTDATSRVAGAEDVIDVPVFGSIAAGFPDGVESGDAVDRLQVNVGVLDRKRLPDTFALRVRGESMLDAGINDGDTVVVERRVPKEGEIVVALIDGQSTLKRLTTSPDGLPVLRSENRAFPSLYPLRELIVQGVATALVRRL
jgi:repressor LexA